MSFEGVKTEAGKQLWKEASAFFDDLLNELNSLNFFRKGVSHKAREKLFLSLKNYENHYSALIDMGKRFESEKTLLEFEFRSGMSSQTLTYAFLSQLIGMTLLNYEVVFKTSLLFFLQKRKGKTELKIYPEMTLGKLLEFIKANTTKTIQKRLTRFIDNKIRNSLAHGTYWFKEDGQKVCLAKNSYLEKVDDMPFLDFLTEITKLSLAMRAFSDVLIKKCEAGYFKQ